MGWQVGDYETRLVNLNLLPVSLWLEAQDVIFLAKLMVDPPTNFCLSDYISFFSSSTRASSQNRIKRTYILVSRAHTYSYQEHIHTRIKNTY